MLARTRKLASVVVCASLLGGCAVIDLWSGRDAASSTSLDEPDGPAAATGADVNDSAADIPIARPGRPLMRRIQAALNEQGIDAGPADGLSGSRTVLAIRLFKVARRMEVTDDVTPRLLAELGLTLP